MKLHNIKFPGMTNMVLFSIEDKLFSVIIHDKITKVIHKNQYIEKRNVTIYV